MIYTVVYGSARTGDYLIVAIKKSQLVPFQGQHDCRLTTACTNETQKYKWVRALTAVASLSVCETSTVQGHFLAVS
jgi:hypothetical protein